MHPNTLRARDNRERILAAGARVIAEVGYLQATRQSVMAGTGLSPNSLRAHFPHVAALATAICDRHARALLEATGCVDPDDAIPPRAALVDAAARILACIDAHPHAHTVLMRDQPCLPPPARANLAYLDDVAAFQVDRAWSALRPDLATPDRLASLTKPLRTLLLRWPDWREPGPPGRPDAAADRAVAMVEATIDRAPPAVPPTPVLDPHAHWLPGEAAARCTAVGAPPRHAPQDAAPQNPPIRHALRDAPGHAPRDTPPNALSHPRLDPPPAAAPAPKPVPAHPGLTLRDTLDRHGLPPTLAATRLGISRQRLHQLTRGTRAITPDTALRLEALLGEHAETWMARQARHDIDAGRRRAALAEAKQGQGSALDPPGASRPWTGVR